MYYTRQMSFIIVIILLVFAIIGCSKSPTETDTTTTGTISGEVTDAVDGSAIPEATVTTKPVTKVVNTDSLGHYSIFDLSPNQYTVCASKQDYESDSVSVTVAVDETVIADIALKHSVGFLKWQFFVDKPIYYSTPAIADDGTIYFGTGVYLHTTSGGIYAIDPNGTLKWSFDLDNNVASPAIGDDGTIYVIDRKDMLYALNPNGTLKWKYDDYEGSGFAEVGQKTVAIGYNGTLYLLVETSLYAVNTDGTRKWKFDPQRGGTACGTSAIVGRDGTIYVILGGDVLYAIRPDGTLEWEFFLENYDEHSFSSPAIDADDVIYFGTENADGGYVYAVYPNGTLKWKYTVGSKRPVRASPAIGTDGTIYIATKAYSHREAAELVALSPEGAVKWRFTVESVHFTPDDVYSTPTIGADGIIYFGAETGFVYALNPDGTLNWKNDLQCGINWSSPAIIEDGTIYIGGIAGEWNGYLYALESTSYGLATSPWPKFRQNNKNNGRCN